MKILIITKYRKNSSANFPFNFIINNLSNHHTIDVVYSGNGSGLDKKRLNKYLNINSLSLNDNFSTKLYFIFMNIFKIDPFFFFWYWKIIKNIKNEYDIVFAFIGLGCLSPLYVASKISSRFKCKCWVHAVDPIPPRLGWISEYNAVGLKKFMHKYLFNVDVYSSSNAKMLKYQLSFFSMDKYKMKGIVILNPCSEAREYEHCEEKTFLYTGKFYALRKPNYLLAAFKKLLGNYPDAKLILVGCFLSKNDLDIFSASERKQIEYINHYIEDLDPYYTRSSVLVDIDGDIEEDEFLSGKMSKYITINRLILSETGNNTPSKYYFSGIPSIIQCRHNVDSVYKGMLKAIDMISCVDFSDRNRILDLFSQKTIIGNINSELNFLNE